jgi:hypothetical protein
MAKTKHNLLATADAHVQQIAQEYPDRADFAREQTFDDADVKLMHLYNDDVDICFVFEVEQTTVEIYCNWGRKVATGYVHCDKELDAQRIMEDYFDFVIEDAEESGKGFVYFECAEKEIVQ